MQPDERRPSVRLKMMLVGFGLTAMLTTAALGLLTAAEKQIGRTAR